MKAKALYGGRWYAIKMVNFSTGYITLINDDMNTLNLGVGNTLTLPIKYVDDIKV